MRISESEVKAAETLLELEPGYGAEEVVGAYKRIAKEVHPDKPGGDAAKFVAVDRAKHLLTRHLANGPPKPKQEWKPEPCSNCNGKGRLMLRRGFAQIPITCGRCKGSGDAGWESDTVEG